MSSCHQSPWQTAETAQNPDCCHALARAGRSPAAAAYWPVEANSPCSDDQAAETCHNTTDHGMVRFVTTPHIWCVDPSKHCCSSCSKSFAHLLRSSASRRPCTTTITTVMLAESTRPRLSRQAPAHSQCKQFKGLLATRKNRRETMDTQRDA